MEVLRFKKKINNLNHNRERQKYFFSDNFMLDARKKDDEWLERIKFIQKAYYVDFFATKYSSLYEEGMKIMIEEYEYTQNSLGAKTHSAGYVQAYIIRDLMQSRINTSEIKEEIDIIADCLLLCRIRIDIIALITQIDVKKLFRQSEVLTNHLEELHFVDRCFFNVIADGTLEGIKIAREKWDVLRILD